MIMRVTLYIVVVITLK